METSANAKMCGSQAIKAAMQNGTLLRMWSKSRSVNSREITLLTLSFTRKTILSRQTIKVNLRVSLVTLPSLKTADVDRKIGASERVSLTFGYGTWLSEMLTKRVEMISTSLTSPTSLQETSGSSPTPDRSPQTLKDWLPRLEHQIRTPTEASKSAIGVKVKAASQEVVLTTIYSSYEVKVLTMAPAPSQTLETMTTSPSLNTIVLPLE